MCEGFSQEVRQKINYYVYRLIDPRNGETFYVGKGKDDRVFQHIREEINAVKDQDSIELKLRRIREIRGSGLKVIHIIHRHGMDQRTAMEVESALIDAFPGITNVNQGIGGELRGVKTTEEIKRLYQAEVADFGKGKFILINVNRSFPNERNLYDATRFAWRIDVRKARRAEAVIAVQQGLIKGVFKAVDWFPAKRDNFPSMLEDIQGRNGFKGMDVSENYQHLLHKRIPDKYSHRGARNRSSP
jgi:hypothetical protein